MEYAKFALAMVVALAGLYGAIDSRLDSIERHLTAIETKLGMVYPTTKVQP
jgi:hypothetical protein